MGSNLGSIRSDQMMYENELELIGPASHFNEEEQENVKNFDDNVKVENFDDDYSSSDSIVVKIRVDPKSKKLILEDMQIVQYPVTENAYTS